MIPWKTVAEAGPLALRQRGDEWMVQAQGRILMGSRRHGSEEALARVGCAALPGERPKVLVGGLGFGFTLRAALDALPATAEVVVAEFFRAVVGWNETHVGHLAGEPLQDHRVTVEVGDVLKVMQAHRGAFDVILLDVDNGPFAVTRDENSSLYGLVGLSSALGALKPGGRLVVWSATPQGGFERKLRDVGFRASREKAGDGRHVLYVGERVGEAIGFEPDERPRRGRR